MQATGSLSSPSMTAPCTPPSHVWLGGVTEDCLQGVQHMALCSAIHFCSATVSRSVVLSR